jgi:hypothetical protein
VESAGGMLVQFVTVALGHGFRIWTQEKASYPFLPFSPSTTSRSRGPVGASRSPVSWRPGTPRAGPCGSEEPHCTHRRGASLPVARGCSATRSRRQGDGVDDRDGAQTNLAARALCVRSGHGEDAMELLVRAEAVQGRE